MKNADKPINPIKKPSGHFFDEKDEDFIQQVKPFFGLTKREYFAGLAMQGFLANPSVIELQHGESAMIWIANHSIKQADELLRQLENKNNGK